MLLTGPAQRLMARMHRFRRAPREALLVWQAVSLSGVLAALSLAPASVAGFSEAPTWLVWLGLLIAAAMVARLLWSGHTVGSGIRADRRRHRDLVDLLGTHADPVHGTQVRVLAHPTPTAYCLPGLRRRVVLSEGALAALPADELTAVLAHERAHLRARHDLVLEFFTVLHRSAPPWLRAPEALREVRLLIEVLADRAARRTAGEVPLARALVTLARGAHPQEALGAGGESGGESTTAARMALLAQPTAGFGMRLVMTAFGLVVVAAPVLLLFMALV